VFELHQTETLTNAEITLITTDEELALAFNKTKVPISGLKIIINMPVTDPDKLKQIKKSATSTDIVFLTINESINELLHTQLVDLLTTCKSNRVLIIGILVNANLKIDSLPNFKKKQTLSDVVTITDSFFMLNTGNLQENVLLTIRGIRSITDFLDKKGLISVDFCDIKMIMMEQGMGAIGFGSARGNLRAKKALDALFQFPGFNHCLTGNHKAILINITAATDLSMSEFEEIGDQINNKLSGDVPVVIGVIIDPELKDLLILTVFVTGCNDMNQYK